MKYLREFDGPYKGKLWCVVEKPKAERERCGKLSACYKLLLSEAFDITASHKEKLECLYSKSKIYFGDEQLN